MMENQIEIYQSLDGIVLNVRLSSEIDGPDKDPKMINGVITVVR